MEVFRVAIVYGLVPLGRCDQEPLAIQDSVETNQAIVGNFFDPT